VLNANGTSVADGALINNWLDKSGNTRNFNDFIGDPNYVLSSTHGLPAVNFDGNDALRSNNADNPRTFIDGNGEYTLIAVARYSGTDRERVIAAKSGHNWLYGFHGNSTKRWYADGWISLDVGGGSSDDTWHLDTGLMNVFGDASDPAADFYRDGVLLTNDGRGSGNAFNNYVPDGLSLGAWNGLGESSTSEVSELIMYNRVLNEAEHRFSLLKSTDGGTTFSVVQQVDVGSASVNGDTITFAVNSTVLETGLYTLGTASTFPLLSPTPYSLSYNVGDGAVPLDANFGVTDLDSANLQSATIAIQGFTSGDADVLAFVNQNGISGSYSSTTGVLTLSGVSSVANYQTALRSITFSTTSSSIPQRSVVFTVTDTDVNTSNSAPIVSSGDVTLQSGQLVLSNFANNLTGTWTVLNTLTRAEVQFKSPSMGGQVVIKPSDPAQAGIWNATFVDARIDNAINVNSNSTINNVEGKVTLTNLNAAGGVTVTMDGSGEIAATAPDFNGQVTVNTDTGVTTTLSTAIRRR
jgi:hypothetical protein